VDGGLKLLIRLRIPTMPIRYSDLMAITIPLGLKLGPFKGARQVIVIDHIESRPENEAMFIVAADIPSCSR